MSDMSALVPSFLQRSRIVASPGWTRWLVPPAALSIHLAIGQVYAWSVFKNPLEESLGISGVASSLPFVLGIIMLGVSSAVFGTAVDRNGPRWAMAVATICFSGGFLISAFGASIGQYWLVLFGYGVVGGIGLGIGYISPVSTLIKWFPDRPGLSTGMAIMGFGGGALIASPWSSSMLTAFGRDLAGISQTYLVHGIVYAVFMTMGTLLIRVPPEGWRPPGWSPPAAQTAAGGSSKMITTANVSANSALRTPQFWLLWVVLCFNVTAGIGILERAAPIIRQFFANTPAAVSVAAAAGFVSLLSLANMSGRFIWSTTSDYIGRKNVYRMYLGVGALLYLFIALVGSSSIALFIVATMLIISFYGGGFSTVPSYLKDLFGTYQVGAIHGRLLTAWSAAGVFGPVIVNYIADQREAAGASGPALYTLSFYIMVGLLVIGFICNELIRPVDEKFHEPEKSTEIHTPGEART